MSRYFDDALYAAFCAGYKKGITNVPDSSITDDEAEVRRLAAFEQFRAEWGGHAEGDYVLADSAGVSSGVPGSEEPRVPQIPTRESALKVRVVGPPRPAFAEGVCEDPKCGFYAETVDQPHVHHHPKKKKKSNKKGKKKW